MSRDEPGQMIRGKWQHIVQQFWVLSRKGSDFSSGPYECRAIFHHFRTDEIKRGAGEYCSDTENFTGRKPAQEDLSTILSDVEHSGAARAQQKKIIARITLVDDDRIRGIAPARCDRQDRVDLRLCHTFKKYRSQMLPCERRRQCRSTPVRSGGDGKAHILYSIINVPLWAVSKSPLGPLRRQRGGTEEIRGATQF